MRCVGLFLALAAMGCAAVDPPDIDLEAAPHLYSRRPPADRFTRLKEAVLSGRVELDSSSDLVFLKSLLRALDVPVSSQLLLHSATSLQITLISPANPRALYFNDEVYVGYIPGGKIEVIALDPALGSIFYIFDIPRPGQRLVAERSGRCMNCHAGPDTRHVPGLLSKSVVPGPNGGGLVAFRQDRDGHSVPLKERFAGWYLTGGSTGSNSWANLTGRLSPAGLARIPLSMEHTVPFALFPTRSSDLLAHLVHEHQVGFVNRAVAAGYRVREAEHQGGPGSEMAREQIRAGAEELTRYLLFADEAPLEAEVSGTVPFAGEYRRDRKSARGGDSLKDFNLKTRLFEHRCSPMIHTSLFAGLPPGLRQAVLKRIQQELDGGGGWLPAAEKRTIRLILSETVPGFPG